MREIHPILIAQYMKVNLQHSNMNAWDSLEIGIKIIYLSSNKLCKNSKTMYRT